MHDEELLTVDDAAKKVKVHPETIRGWIRSGELPAVDIGGKYRIYPEDLDAFLRRRKTTKGKEGD
jgi:excisionase family DNA binding protein